MTDLHGKAALVTGSTDGVGRCVAKALAEAGAHVLVHGRNETRGQLLLDAIAADGGKADLLIADLSSLQGVRHLAEAVHRRTDSLHLLINNAGIGTGRPGAEREASADGHELRFAVNYLAGFLLTRLLLPLIKERAPARIINVASAGQQAIDFDNLMLTHGYSGSRAYCQSKLAQVMFTFDLAEELAGEGVAVNCLHPATYMDTAMVREAGVRPHSSIDEGKAAIFHLAASPDLRETTGRYFEGRHEARAEAQAYDPAARARLREISLELTGLASAG